MNANDAQFSRIFVTTTGGTIPDSTPNESNGAIAASFDLVVQAEAGYVVANSGGNYTLAVVAFDLTAGTKVAALDVPPTGQEFGGPLWTGGISVQRFPKAVPAGLGGHVLQYTASLVSKNGQIVAFAQSELFILI